MDCDWEIIGEYTKGQLCKIRCRKCGTVRTAKNPFRYYKVCPKGGGLNGPGAKLTELLKELGIEGPVRCSCQALSQKMDVRGAEWCKENIASIIEQIEANGKQMDWVTYLANSAKVVAVGYFSLRAIVDEAIRRAETT